MSDSAIQYNTVPANKVLIDESEVNIFSNAPNVDSVTVESFGKEWKKFSHFKDDDIQKAGSQYFDLVTDSIISKSSVALDVGCGSGRWSVFLSEKVKWVEAVDPSESIFSAMETYGNKNNIRWSQASANQLPFNDETFDFAICLGVLHHVPDTNAALNNIVKKIKPGGHLLIYLYYSLENRNYLFRLVYGASELLRKIISLLPFTIKRIVTWLIAATIYLPVAYFCKLCRFLFPNKDYYKKIPLSYYCDKSFYIMKNDALDRFGTSLQKRFNKNQIEEMLHRSGCDEVIFSPHMPYWHAIARKKVSA